MSSLDTSGPSPAELGINPNALTQEQREAIQASGFEILDDGENATFCLAYSEDDEFTAFLAIRNLESIMNNNDVKKPIFAYKPTSDSDPKSQTSALGTTEKIRRILEDYEHELSVILTRYDLALPEEKQVRISLQRSTFPKTEREFSDSQILNTAQNLGRLRATNIGLHTRNFFRTDSKGQLLVVNAPKEIERDFLLKCNLHWVCDTICGFSEDYSTIFEDFEMFKKMFSVEPQMDEIQKKFFASTEEFWQAVKAFNENWMPNEVEAMYQDAKKLKAWAEGLKPKQE